MALKLPEPNKQTNKQKSGKHDQQKNEGGQPKPNTSCMSKPTDITSLPMGAPYQQRNHSGGTRTPCFHHRPTRPPAHHHPDPLRGKGHMGWRIQGGGGGRSALHFAKYKKDNNNQQQGMSPDSPPTKTAPHTPRTPHTHPTHTVTHPIHTKHQTAAHTCTHTGCGITYAHRASVVGQRNAGLKGPHRTRRTCTCRLQEGGDCEREQHRVPQSGHHTLSSGLRSLVAHPLTPKHPHNSITHRRPASCNQSFHLQLPETYIQRCAGSAWSHDCLATQRE